MSHNGPVSRFLSGDGSRGGVGAIEFALLAPILALALICTADLGIGIYHDMQVESAAQAGAQYGAVYGFNATNISNAVKNSVSGFTVNASPAPTQSCDCPSSGGVSQVTCGSTCADGTLAGTYINVSASGTYTTIIPYPTLPAKFTLAATAVVRIQ